MTHSNLLSDVLPGDTDDEELVARIRSGSRESKQFSNVAVPHRHQPRPEYEADQSARVPVDSGTAETVRDPGMRSMIFVV